jgi:hypothetical protein
MRSQDTLRRMEFGCNIISVSQLRSNFHPSFLNGLFVRYKIKRIAFRGNLGYREYKTFTETNKYCADCAYEQSETKEFRFGIGIQRSVIMNKDWLYGFLDVGYRNSFRKGIITGGFAGYNDRFTSNTNGVDYCFGLGFKIRTFRNLFLSPELGYNLFHYNTDYNSVSMNSGYNNSWNLTRFNIKKMARLMLTARF